MNQVLILCEGYDDRAFWRCWLLSLGAVDLFVEAAFDRTKLDENLRRSGVKSSDGDFCLRAGNGDILLIRPSKGVDKLWGKARVALKDGLVNRLILNCDSDQPSDREPLERRKLQLEQLRAELRADIAIDLVVWHCGDPPGLPGVPEQQTLERLICAAIAAAQPEQWKQAVESFLRLDPVFGPTHKNFAHAYWAKFFAHDFDDLYQAVWSRERYPEIAAGLEQRLRSNGDWDRVAALIER